MPTPAQTNLAAETRAVEAGHRAFVQPGGWIRVTSDTHGDLGKFYRVEFTSTPGAPVRFTCTPDGAKAFADDHLHTESGRPGVVPCMHAALAARRLEREGLAVLDETGLWRDVRPFVSRQPDDPFDGLPS